jgi:type IV fimbrial biogenesis protein FimT
MGKWPLQPIILKYKAERIGMSDMSRNGGFTLLELMMTIVVLTVVIGIAVPSFLEVIDRNAVTGSANDLLTSMLRARSEAIKTETRVHVEHQGDWSQWRSFTDQNENGNYNPNAVPPDVLIEQYINDGPVPVGNGAVVNDIDFSPRGRTVATLDETDDFFQITQGNHTRFICFSPTGRPRVQEEACP